jgi:hypothetical protein
MCQPARHRATMHPNTVLVTSPANDTSVKHACSTFATLLMCLGDLARTIFAC